jgi:hypothetical protein
MKRIVLIILSWASFMYAPPCFQPADGMNLWRMTAEMGSCLDIVLCSVGSVVMIMQTDLAAPYVITQPNYYKICENITSANSITISSDNVVLDLGSFFLDGVSIIVSNGVKNVTIKNGTIQNVAQGITIGSSTQNIVVENIVLDTAVSSATMYGIQVTGPMLGLTLRDISFYDAAPTNIALIGSVANSLSNVFFENIRCESTNQALSSTFAIDATINVSGCTNMSIDTMLINDPANTIDSIFITNSDGISLNEVNILSSLTAGPPLTAAIRIVNSSNIDHVQVHVAGEAFFLGFFVENINQSATITNIFYDGCSVNSVSGNGFGIAGGTGSAVRIAYENCAAIECGFFGMALFSASDITCTDCNTSNNAVGLRLSGVEGVSVTGHTATNNTGYGIFISTSFYLSIQDCVLSQNGSAGLYIEDPLMLSTLDFVIENVTSVANGMQGMSFSSVNDVIIKDSILQSNQAEGIFCDFVDNVVISGCEAQGNVGSGFRVQGVNEGHTPGDPELAVGRSPVLIEGCAAIENGSNGFYTFHVGGVLIRDCFASYNGTRGFWFDTGSWNAQIESSTALSNTSAGFLTWDTAVGGISTYSNRFRDCYGGNNGTGSAFDPLGGFDFAQSNSPGFTTLTPIAAIYPSSVLGTPEAVLAGAVSPIFCIYE